MADRHTPDPDHAEAFDSTLSDTPLEMTEATPFPDSEDTLTDTGTTVSRGPSRSTRILLAALLLAVAAFVWFNYVWQPEPEVTVLPPAPAIDNGGLAGNGGLNGAVPLVADQSSQSALPLQAGQEPASPAGTEAADVTVRDDGVIVLPAPRSAARDLEISELPFLVTEPVAEATGEMAATAEAAAPERPTAVRVSVNPFSPVVLPEQAVADSAGAPPPAAVLPAEQVTHVSIPDGPDQTAITSIAPPAGSTAPPGGPAAAAVAEAAQPPVSREQVPVPAPTAPAATSVGSVPAPAAAASTSLAQSLPRPLPGPPLSPVPAVLQERRAAGDVPQPNLAQVAVLDEPVPAVGTDVAERVPDLGLSVPEVLPPVASRVMPSDADPLVAGITPLSRYLRDHDVTFTGMVLGPVSQGVFRSSSEARPVVVGLGQALPDTDITLTDLRGQQAEFTLADASQFLTLELRR